MPKQTTRNHQTLMFLQRSSIVVFLWLFPLFLFGQSDKVVFQPLKDGISHHQVRSILEDREGFVWIGTYDGLNKYDGINFSIYENNPADSNSICHNTINTMVEDKDRQIWVGTACGLCVYDPVKDQFSIPEELLEMDLFYIKTLFCDEYNRIWIGTLGCGLFMYDQENAKMHSFLHDENKPETIGADFVNSVISDNEGNIWVGTQNGLDLYDSHTQTFHHFANNPRDLQSLSSNVVECLTIGKDGELWVGTHDGVINKLMIENGKPYFLKYQPSDKVGDISNNAILSLCCDYKGNLWVGTENGGLSCLYDGSDKFTTYCGEEGKRGRLNSNSVWSLYEDRSGILWIGTYNNGVSVVDSRSLKFELLQRDNTQKNTLVSNNVKSFSEDDKGNLWIATDGGGLCCFNTKKQCFEKQIDNSSLSSQSLMELMVDQYGDIWAGTWAGGIERFDKNGVKIKNYKEKEDHSPIRNVMSLCEDKTGNIWAGTSGSGLLLYNRARDVFAKFVECPNDSYLTNTAFVNDILEDSDGVLWVATMFGLVAMEKTKDGYYKQHKYKYTKSSKSISSFRVTCLFEDSGHNLWVGTENGLNLFNKKDSTFMVYRKQHGLPNNAIKAILEDNSGYLWLSTNKGLSKFNYNEGTFVNFSKQDGLSTNEFNIGACLKSRSGEIFFAGNNGIDSFYPDSIKFNTYIPPVYITRFRLFNTPEKSDPENPLSTQNIVKSGKTTLPYNRNSFSLEFVALNYTRSEKNQYAYKLEGFDKEWNYVGDRHMATYTNLNAGKYIFKVIGSNNDGVWNKTPAQLEITISRPYWRTNGAYALYVLSFLLMLYSFIRLILIREKQAQSLRLEKINREKKEELNRMKTQFFTNISHELRTPLSLIIAPLEEIISDGPIKGALGNRICLVYRNAKNLFQLVNEFMDFAKFEEKRLKLDVQKGDIVTLIRYVYSLFADEAIRRNFSYRFVTETDRIETWFDRDKMEKIVSNLISNAFKHTPDGGSIQVTVREKNASERVGGRQVIFSVIDNGVGIAPEYIGKVFERFFQSPEKEMKPKTGIGVGLAMVKNLVEMHKGSVHVSSEKTNGTCFSVTIPIPGRTPHKLKVPSEVSAKAKKGVKQLLPEEDQKSGFIAMKSNTTILIIEDNTELRRYIVSVLSGKYKIIEAINGDEGFSLAKNHTPDLIVSDVIMPGLTGIELCKKVKEDISTSHIPVILLTSKVSLEDKIEGIETGADAYITKPFNAAFLMVNIKKLIESRRKLLRQFSQEVCMLPREQIRNGLDEKFLKGIINYVQDNVANDDITVENLSAYLAMNRSNVYRKIKALTGQTAAEFIRTIRLKMAIKYIELGEYNIAEVGYKVGFSSPSYFAKCFKTQFGKSPSQFLAKGYNASPNYLP